MGESLHEFRRLAAPHLAQQPLDSLCRRYDELVDAARGGPSFRNPAVLALLQESGVTKIGHRQQAIRALRSAVDSLTPMQPMQLPSTRPRPLDYSRFDKIGSDSDSEERLAPPSPARQPLAPKRHVQTLRQYSTIVYSRSDHHYLCAHPPLDVSLAAVGARSHAVFIPFGEFLSRKCVLFLGKIVYIRYHFFVK